VDKLCTAHVKIQENEALGNADAGREVNAERVGHRHHHTGDERRDHGGLDKAEYHSYHRRSNREPKPLSVKNERVEKGKHARLTPNEWLG